MDSPPIARIGESYQAKLPSLGEESSRQEPQLQRIVSERELHPFNRTVPCEDNQHRNVTKHGKGLFSPLGPYLPPENGDYYTPFNPQKIEAGGEPEFGWVAGIAPGEQKRMVSSTGHERLVYHCDKTGALVCFKVGKLNANGKRALCDDWCREKFKPHLRYCKHIVEMEGRRYESGAAKEGLVPLSKGKAQTARMALRNWQRRGIELELEQESIAFSETEGDWDSSETD